jgi:hypothetical protein
MDGWIEMSPGERVVREVRLMPFEMRMAGAVGLERNIEAICSGRKARFPEKFPGELFANHILGAMAEAAVAKYLGWYWGGHVNNFNSGDLRNTEVRWGSGKNLKVRERDEGTVVAVTGTPPLFSVQGYIYAERARELVKPSSPRPGPPAYFVPFEYLNDVSELVW